MAAPLFHIYGSLAIHPYGLALCIGVLFAAWRASLHPWCTQIITIDRLMNLVNVVVVTGIIGSRLLHVITEPEEYSTIFDVLRIWEGGLSSWGAVISLLIVIPLYAWREKIPLLLTLDLCALYAPLVHAISRFGCLAAGCCGGIITHVPWAIFNEAGLPVHPTQLYSSVIFLLIFIIMKQTIVPYFHRPGQTTATYLLFVGLERFIVDWWRNDRIMMSSLPLLSVHQSIALCIIGLGIFCWCLVQQRQSRPYEYF